MKWKNFSRLSIFWLVLVVSPGVMAEAVWIDVRGVFEHVLDNIEGDIRISHDEIVEEVEEQFPDKSTEIHLYCASGQRAGKAREALIEAGYENVWNEGGIDDARKARGLER